MDKWDKGLCSSPGPSPRGQLLSGREEGRRGDSEGQAHNHHGLQRGTIGNQKLRREGNASGKAGHSQRHKHELCFAVHAEQNAIIQAARLGISIDKATLYCTHQPCVICAKMIINAGISRVVYEHGYPDEFSLQLFEEANIKVEKYMED